MDVFLNGFLLSLSVCLDIGLVNVAIMRAGLQGGVRPAFLIGLGSSFGDLTYAALSGIAITFVLGFPPVRWALWIGGTVFLLVLTVQMLRDAAGKRPEFRASVSPTVTPWRSFLQGWSLALASPSAILWFATVGGSLIAAQVQDHSALVPFFGGFLVAGVAWSLVMAVVVGLMRRVLDDRIIRGLSLTSAALFLYFAVTVFLDGYRTLVAP